MDLLHPYLGEGHRLFVDNFYTSIPLFLELLQRKSFATGSIISNRRHFPEGLKAVNLHEVGSYRFAVCDKMMACVWHDRCKCYHAQHNAQHLRHHRAKTS